jgi:hypothetical protein
MLFIEIQGGLNLVMLFIEIQGGLNLVKQFLEIQGLVVVNWLEESRSPETKIRFRRTLYCD